MIPDMAEKSELSKKLWALELPRIRIGLHRVHIYKLNQRTLCKERILLGKKKKRIPAWK